MNPHLLITKIIVPSRRSDVLRRPRLLDFLHEYIERKLILVSASAGYGKTSLLVDFAHDTALALCWYTLDPNDRDPRVFLEYLVASIRRRFPHFGGRTTALLEQREEKQALDAYIGALVTDIQHDIDEFFVIVLDDYHLVEDSAAINQFLDRLLYVLPENAHLILASRTVPGQLTLTRLTAQLQVVGLGMNDLRFTADEIRALVEQNFHMDITPTIASELARQSDGWITGLVLTTPTLWRGLFSEWVRGYGPGSQLFEYLAVEVLDHQQPELQQFLLDTSILAEMDVALCNELFGRSDTLTMLQLAEKRNLFVTRVGEQGYRYHHLFRDFLLHRLRETQPEHHRVLLEQAAELFERHGKTDQAIEQWLAAQNPARAARLIEILIDGYYEAGRWTTLTRWLDALPEAFLAQNPQLQLWRAILDAEMGSVEAAQALFVNAIAEFERRGDSLNLARALLESARHETALQAVIQRCERALALVPEHEHSVHAMGYRVLGLQKALHGDQNGAIPLLEHAAELYEITHQRYQLSDVEMNLGGAYFVVGNRARALAHLENVRGYWQQVGNSAKLANTLNSIAVAHYWHGELEQATALLHQALEHAQRAGHVRTEGYILASLGDIYRDQEKLADALQTYTQAATGAEKIREHYLVAYARSAAADIWRIAGDLVTAEQVLQNTLDITSGYHSEFEMAFAQLALCCLRLAQNQPDAAVRHLDYAMPLLARAHAVREMGRAHFCYAHAALLRGRETEALRHLRALVKLGKQLNENQFLVSVARHARHVVDFALKRRIGTAFWRALVKKLDYVPVAPIEISALEESLPELELYTLGEARVMLNGKAVPHSAWQTATTKELFFFFATQPQGWRKEQIIEELWQNSARGQASDLFHASLYRLRRALFPECILFRDGMYRMNTEAVRWLDVYEFVEERARVSELTDPKEQIEPLERVVALYHGDFLQEIYSDWCVPRRNELRAQYLESLSQLGQTCLELGNVKRAEEVYRKILEVEPAREETWRALMQLYLRMGNRTAAMQTFQDCVEALQRELEMPPLPATLELYRQILEQI